MENGNAPNFTRNLCSGFLRTINLTLKRRTVQPSNDPQIDPEMIAVFLVIDPEMIHRESYEWRRSVGPWIAQ